MARAVTSRYFTQGPGRTASESLRSKSVRSWRNRCRGRRGRDAERRGTHREKLGHAHGQLAAACALPPPGLQGLWWSAPASSNSARGPAVGGRLLCREFRDSGGHVCVLNGSTLTIDSSRFTRNSASAAGGAALVADSSACERAERWRRPRTAVGHRRAFIIPRVRLVLLKEFALHAECRERRRRHLDQRPRFADVGSYQQTKLSKWVEVCAYAQDFERQRYP